MILDFKEIIENRTIVLNNRIENLRNSLQHLELSNPVQFSIQELQNDYNPRVKGKKVGVESLNFLEEIKAPTVYIFEIINWNHLDLVKDNFIKYRENSSNLKKNKKRVISHLPRNFSENDSNYLYVGSKKRSVHLRVKEHLGLVNYQTGALNLKYWLPEKIQLNFYYVILPDAKLTYEIEASISQSLKPLIGKREL